MSNEETDTDGGSGEYGPGGKGEESNGEAREFQRITSPPFKFACPVFRRVNTSKSPPHPGLISYFFLFLNGLRVPIECI